MLRQRDLSKCKGDSQRLPSLALTKDTLRSELKLLSLTDKKYSTKNMFTTNDLCREDSFFKKEENDSIDKDKSIHNFINSEDIRIDLPPKMSKF
mmetsp:Transcript_18699/g.20882  ORF Transcript_18699/g.20882 Transcript_18699/m.20882 type:complete len:94 (-) Transcript_18699:94-375(-)